MVDKNTLSTLGAEDAKLFYKLDWGLMYYANQKYGIMKNVDKPDFHDRNTDEISKLKEKIFSEPEIIDSFTSENPLGFSDEEISIVRCWKNFIKDEFFVVSHGRKGSAFILRNEPPKVYVVVGIMDELEDLLHFPPYLIKTVILPFKGRIVYYGVFNTYNITFGGGIRRSLGTEYARAKAEHNLIASFDAPPEKNPASDADLVRFYVQRREKNPEYRRELGALLTKKPELHNTFTLEVGKKCARVYRKNLNRSNVRTCWLAVFFDTIIASGESEREAIKRAKRLVPADEAGGIYTFKHEGHGF